MAVVKRFIAWLHALGNSPIKPEPEWKESQSRFQERFTEQFPTEEDLFKIPEFLRRK